MSHEYVNSHGWKQIVNYNMKTAMSIVHPVGKACNQESPVARNVMNCQGYIRWVAEEKNVTCQVKKAAGTSAVLIANMSFTVGLSDRSMIQS